MTHSQIRRLIRLHQKAERHASEYKRLFSDCSAQSKALDHLRKAEQLYSRISDIIRDINPPQAQPGGGSADG
jgi:hypothetical protein